MIKAIVALGLVGVVSAGAEPAGFTRVKLSAGPADWRAPSAALVLVGDASYYRPGLLDQVARNRGLDLSRYRDGVALMRAGDLGRSVWIFWPDDNTILGGSWAGPYLSVDCSRRVDYASNLSVGRIVETSWREWIGLGLPDRPVAVILSFVEPWPMAVAPR